MSQNGSFWRSWTQARIGLGRTGHSLPTSEILSFRQAHALARDAVLSRWEVEHTGQSLGALGEATLTLSSNVTGREEYLKRPDLGRKLSDVSLSQVTALRETRPDLVFIASDGLSATAVHQHLVPFWTVFREGLVQLRVKIAPLILVPFSRVALSNDVGHALGAKLSVMIIGERPGLSSVDSLGVYLTYDPKPNTTDAQRNCISNIRPPHGLSYEVGAKQLSFLIRESLIRKISGTALKQESDLLGS